jgi:hypothetical protein
MIKTELVEPAPAMNERNYGIRPGGFRQAQLTKLQGFRAIVYAVIGNIARQRLNLTP